MHPEKLWQDWLANLFLLWVAYFVLMAQRLIALDKKPDICLVGIGEIFQRLLAKLVIADAGYQVKLACRSKQLCAGLEAGIKGMLHTVLQWLYYPSENIDNALTPPSPSDAPKDPAVPFDNHSDDDSLFLSDFQDPPTM